MKRILILIAISLFLYSTAGAFQDGGGKSTKNPKPTPKPKAPSSATPKVEPPKRTSTLDPSPVPTVTNAIGRSLAAFRGKVVILNFFATWAAPCRVQISILVELQNKYRNHGLEIVGVSIDPIAPRGNPGGALAVAPFMKDNGINYHVWMIDNVSALFGFDVSQGIPTTYVLDREGRIVKTYLFFRPITVFEDDIKQMLGVSADKTTPFRLPAPPARAPADETAFVGANADEVNFDGAETTLTKSFALSEAPTISVKNVSGSINISVWDKPEAEVKVTRRGSEGDRNFAPVFFRKERGNLVVRTDDRPGSSDVRYQLKLPREIAGLDLSSVTGAIILSDIEGEITVQNVSGQTDLTNITGLRKAGTVSGHINIVLREWRAERLELNAVSGNISLQIKSAVDADLEASSVNGSISLDDSFGIAVEKHMVGQSARGKMGEGGETLKITTVSGNIKVSK